MTPIDQSLFGQYVGTPIGKIYRCEGRCRRGAGESILCDIVIQKLNRQRNILPVHERQQRDGMGRTTRGAGTVVMSARVNGDDVRNPGPRVPPIFLLTRGYLWSVSGTVRPNRKNWGCVLFGTYISDNGCWAIQQLAEPGGCEMAWCQRQQAPVSAPNYDKSACDMIGFGLIQQVFGRGASSGRSLVRRVFSWPPDGKMGFRGFRHETAVVMVSICLSALMSEASLAAKGVADSGLNKSRMV